MTVGHLFFAVASTAYIAVGVRFEERDLRTNLGAEYEEYAARVPAIVPPLTPSRLHQRLEHPVVGGHLGVPLHTDRE
jgi:hypothetical protein